MKKKHIILLVIAGCITLFLALTSYHAGPWRGQVIDAETKKPIEGAAVVAVWQKEFRLNPAGAFSTFLDAKETLTDKDGRFEIPSKVFLSIQFVRYVHGPYFTIYKPGYGPLPGHQVAPKLYDEKTVFLGRGSVIELPKANSYYDRKKFMEDAAPFGLLPQDETPLLNKMREEEGSRLGL